MPRPPPTVLHLPFDMAESFNLARLLAGDSDLSWSRGYKLLEQFELRSHEQTFAKRLLQNKRNLWLFRCNQRCYCGDFAVVDMSATRRARRSAYVIELKMGAGLKVGASPGKQLANWREAIAAIASSHDIIDSDCEAELICGGPPATLRYFGIFTSGAARR